MNKHPVFPYDLPPASGATGGAETASRPVNRKTGIVASIVLAVLGLLTFFTPISVGVGMAYLLTAGLMVYGISQTVAFFRAPKEARSGWSLVNGIMLLLFSGFTLWSGLSGVYGTLQMIASLSYVAGFLTIAAGISQISTFFALQRASGSGWIMGKRHPEPAAQPGHSGQPGSQLVYPDLRLGHLSDGFRHRPVCRVPVRPQSVPLLSSGGA